MTYKWNYPRKIRVKKIFRPHLNLVLGTIFVFAQQPNYFNFDHCINCYLNTVFPRYYNLSILHPHQNEDVLEKHEWKKGQKIRMRIQQKYLEQLLHTYKI